MLRPSGLRSALFLAAGVAGVAALVVAVDARATARALLRVGAGPLPLLIATSLAFYLVQGVRWHQLLRAAGARLRLRDTCVINLAGQATGLLPLGELTRVVLAVQATGLAFGAVLATITVQELIYTSTLVAVAVPGALQNRAFGIPMIATLLVVGAILLLLSQPRLWAWMRLLLGRIAPMRRILPQLDTLQQTTGILLRRRDTAVWSLLSFACAGLAVTLFWLVVQALAPGSVGWQTAALIYTISHLAGAVSAIPGGLGAYEASVTGLLIAAGVDPSSAAAAALLHRAADKGLSTVVGVAVLPATRIRVGQLSPARP
jgi:uncharacterized protein (TIRG00374 family)